MSGECEIFECDREATETVLSTERDGGAGPLNLCRPCSNAFKTGSKQKTRKGLSKEEVVYEYGDLRTISPSELRDKLEDEFDIIPGEFYPPRRTNFDKIKGVNVERKTFYEEL